jgi:hypothetical protein
MTSSSRKSRRVVLVVPDLIFATRISETAKRLGVEALASNRATAAVACREVTPDILIVDLEAVQDLAGLKRELEADPASSGTRIVGFYPHVRGDLRAAAVAARIDLVLPRSAFTARLVALLSGDSGTPE